MKKQKRNTEMTQRVRVPVDAFVSATKAVEVSSATGKLVCCLDTIPNREYLRMYAQQVAGGGTFYYVNTDPETDESGWAVELVSML